MLRSMDEIWSFLESNPGKILAWRDDYAYWAKNRFRKEAGKIMLISQDKDAPHEIFFDDNIRLDDPNIIDARDRHSLEPISFVQTQDRHVIAVDPYAAIMDENYFVSLLNDVR